MSRTRWLALAAVVGAALLMGGFGPQQGVTQEFERLAASSSGMAVSIARSSMTPPVVAAVEPGGAPTLTRSDLRPPSRVLFTVLTVVALACAAALRRNRERGRVLELAIRAHSAFYGPASGRRAPPRTRLV